MLAEDEMAKNEILVKIYPEFISISAPYQYIEVCRQVQGGWWNAEDKAWFYPNDKQTAESIVDAFGPALGKSIEANKLREQAGGGTLSGLYCPHYNTDEELPEIPSLIGESWHHQRAGYRFAMEHDGCLLPFKMGYGKTRTAVGVFMNRGRLALILCPKSVVPIWPQEFEKHIALSKGASLVEDGIVVIPLNKGTISKKVDLAKLAILGFERHKYKKLALVINYESAWRPEFAEWAINNAGFDTVIFDEAHKIKGAGSKISLFCSRLSDAVKYKIALAGTPMPHSPLDIYGIYRALDKSIFGTNFAWFKKIYCITKEIEVKNPKTGEIIKAPVTVGFKAMRQMREKISQIAMFILDNLIELPPVQDIKIPIEISSSAMRIIKDLEKGYFSELKDGRITAGNILVKLLRMQQVTSGYVKTDEGHMVEVDTGKREALEDLIVGIDEPIVVFAKFASDLANVARVCENLKVEYRELSGRVNQLAEWQEGKAQVIGVNIQCGGAGIDLTRARYCIYYSICSSLGDYEQSRARVHRPGQERPVTYYHLVAEGTVADSRVYDALQDHKDVIMALMADIN